MATEQETKPNSKVAKLIGQYEDMVIDTNTIELMVSQYRERLREIESTNIRNMSSEEIDKLCDKLESEMNKLDSKEASKMPNKTCLSLKEHYITIIHSYRNTVREARSLNESLTELAELDTTIDIHHTLLLIQYIESEMERLEEKATDIPNVPQEIRASIKYHYLTTVERCRDILRYYVLVAELATMEASDYQSNETAFEKRITTARQELQEVKSNNTIDDHHKQELIVRYETEFQRLDKEAIDPFLSHVPTEIRTSIKEQYLTNVQQCRDIVKYYQIIAELAKMKAPIYKINVPPFERQITTASRELKDLKSTPTVDDYHKQELVDRFETELQRLDKEFTDQFLDVEVRYSIDLIEKTLEEPHLYSLPHLIMWRDTAQEKIEKLNNFPIPLPEELVLSLIEIYESLIKQLRAEILELRTYPIPEPWCSHCMRQGLTHLIRGEFIFFVHPRIEEDMRPLILSERDTLPGGLTRQEYDSKMDRLNMESAIAIGKLLEAKPSSDLEWELKWFEETFLEIEEDVNFAFTELPLLYRDGRSLEYLVNKNQDDELLKEIHDILLRRIRHFYSNRINIPSVL